MWNKPFIEINNMNIPFLSLKDVTALHGAEINEAVFKKF